MSTAQLQRRTLPPSHSPLLSLILMNAILSFSWCYSCFSFTKHVFCEYAVSPLIIKCFHPHFICSGEKHLGTKLSGKLRAEIWMDFCLACFLSCSWTWQCKRICFVLKIALWRTRGPLGETAVMPRSHERDFMWESL